MSGRIFQNVVLQLKENTDRTVGVIDGEGIVIACSELAMIGQRWAEHVPAINAAGGAVKSAMVPQDQMADPSDKTFFDVPAADIQKEFDVGGKDIQGPERLGNPV